MLEVFMQPQKISPETFEKLVSFETRIKKVECLIEEFEVLVNQVRGLSAKDIHDSLEK